MGASLSWFAVRGKTPKAVLLDFGLKNVGKEYHKTPFCGGTLPSGWLLRIQDRGEFTKDEVRQLSRGGEVIACFVEEHVVVSRAARWKDEGQIWWGTHDAQGGDGHLDIEGEPPAGFAAIRDRLTGRQEDDGGADFTWNILVDLAREITGHSHEEMPGIAFANFLNPTVF